mmetsp:Transcript_90031/g.155896  ORF Transcript_90031/g.155896 Transcript_90031/m.155896 type:complete len:237 (-) Transcript_90031:129-839(-)
MSFFTVSSKGTSTWFSSAIWYRSSISSASAISLGLASCTSLMMFRKAAKFFKTCGRSASFLIFSLNAFVSFTHFRLPTSISFVLMVTRIFCIAGSNSPRSFCEFRNRTPIPLLNIRSSSAKEVRTFFMYFVKSACVSSSKLISSQRWYSAGHSSSTKMYQKRNVSYDLLCRVASAKSFMMTCRVASQMAMYRQSCRVACARENVFGLDSKWDFSALMQIRRVTCDRACTMASHRSL